MVSVWDRLMVGSSAPPEQRSSADPEAEVICIYVLRCTLSLSFPICKMGALTVGLQGLLGG